MHKVTLDDLEWERIADASLTHDVRRARGKRMQSTRRTLRRITRKRHTAMMRYRMDAVRGDM